MKKIIKSEQDNPQIAALKNAEDMPTGKFLYWLSDEGKQYLPGSTITVTKNQTFTAVYDEREHTVIYML